MRLLRRRWIALLLIGIGGWAGLGVPLRGQAATGGAAAPETATENAPAKPELRIEQVQKRMAELAASNLEAAIKSTLKAEYEEALKKLEEAEANRKKAAEFRQAIQTAPLQTAELERQLNTLPPPEQPSEEEWPPDLDELRKKVESRRAALAALEQRLAQTESELSRVTSRPAQIATRLPQARAELTAITAKLAASKPAKEASPGRLAERTLLEAQRQALASEIEMLQQEQLSQTVRENLLQAQRNLLARQCNRSRTTLAGLESDLQAALTSQARQLASRVDRLIAQTKSPTGAAAPLIEELRTLSDQLLASARLIRKTSAEQETVRSRLGMLAQNYRRIRQEMKITGFADSLAQVVLEQLRRLPNPQSILYSIKTHEKTLRDIRLAAFQIEETLDPNAGPNAADRTEDPHLAELRALRTELLEDLRKNYRTLIQNLTQLDADERAYHDLVREIRDFLANSLFWHQSSPPLGVDSFKDLPAAVKWMWGGERWREGGRALTAIPTRHPGLTLLLVGVVAALQILRPRLKKTLRESSSKIRRIATDRYSHTGRALGATLLLAAPLPVILGFLGWEFLQDPQGSDWLRGLGHGLGWSALFLAWVLPLREIARPGGLGVTHFGWEESATNRLRSTLLKLSVVHVPALLIIYTTQNGRHFDSLGRLSFAFSCLWTTLILAHLFRPSEGLGAGLIQRHPQSLLAKTRWLWFPLLLLIPLLLLVISVSGYALAALALCREFLRSLGLLAAGVVMYGLLLRWFMIKERRLALKEALERRRAKREAANQPEETSDEVISADEEALELDLAVVGRQTRRLLRSLIGLGVVVGIWLLWLRALPASGSGQSEETGLHLLAFAQAALVLGVAVTVVRNLPGLLDLAGLRNTGLDPGTRYAVATIGQYLVSAVTAVVEFQILQIDWSQLGWIVAALSVGLGFGLQEVVANFVCGIILLFERPIRMGDVVTIGEITGTVTSIRMRATTITNWDRQDFIVPNKEFVTGSIINWTLSNSITRFIVRVGVAYGSDTEQAREILLEVARNHPLVLDEPAPAANFEAFGDSTLNLTLRCYLPDLDNRLRVITELHTEIDRRFKEAGIEIAFPQHDLHLRSIDPKISWTPPRSSTL